MALVGLTINIKKAPTIVPIKAPKTGIKAVNPTKTEMVDAYGIFKSNIPIKQRTPIMTASRHCPVIKLPNILLDNSLISIIFFSFFSGK